MGGDTIERDFHEKVSAQIRLHQDGVNRFRVLTPFLFEDGDHLTIVLKKEWGKWVLSDEAHTFMHLTYSIDEKYLLSGVRRKIISNALSMFEVEEHDGELILYIPDGRYGDALYSFVQALLKITDVEYLSRERIQSTFMEDFRGLLSEAAPEYRRSFDWSDPKRDPSRRYTVDCRINSMRRPLFVHALPNDDRTRDATIALLKFQEWGIEFRSLGIFEDQESINGKVLARYSDVCEKHFSSLTENRAGIFHYLSDAIGIPDGGNGVR